MLLNLDLMGPVPYFDSSMLFLYHSLLLGVTTMSTMNVVGQGSFSTVYEYSDTTVLKVGPIDDSAYKFLSWVITQDNPHYPVVHALHKAGDHYVVVMDRLTTFPEDTWGELSPEVIDHVFTLEHAGYNCRMGSERVSSSFEDAMMQIFEEFKTWEPDAHPGNIGWNSEGDMVAFDPLNFDVTEYEASLANNS